LIESDAFVVESKDLVDLHNLINVPKSQHNYSNIGNKSSNKRGNAKIAKYFKV